MKLSVASLKGADYKQMLIDHGEKLVFGLIALIVLVAMIRTNWAPYSAKTPQEIEDKVQSAQSTIRNSSWPVEEQQKFKLTENIADKVGELVSPVEVARYEWVGEMVSPLYKRSEPIKEPRFLPLEEPLATEGRVILATRSTSLMTPAGIAADGIGGPGTTTQKVDPDGISQFAPANNRGRQNNPDVPGGPGESPDRFEDPLAPGVSGPEGELGGSTTGVEGRGRRFVAVRGVIPVRRQLEAIAKALHEPTAKVSDRLQYVDFQIQRQAAVGGKNPWGGAWEDVDIQVALDILNESLDFDEDFVDSNITDAVFTSPLPMRVRGSWARWATHPRVKNYELSREGQEMQRLINQRAAEHQKQYEAELAAQQQVKPGGFAGLQLPIGRIRQDMGGDPVANRTLMQNLSAQLDPEGMNRGAINQIQMKISAAGNLLLFRYFDFAVEPGNAYRYKVRFELVNPNFNRPVEELENPESRDGATRWTDWSAATAPVYIEEDADYFVADVDEGRGRNSPTASIDIFQWYPDAGTFINKVLKVGFGQFVGGKAKTEVLRPAPETWEEEVVDFSTGDVLVDALPDIRVDTDMHADLRLPSSARGKVGIVNEAIMVNEYGELVSLDPRSRQAQHYQLRKRLEAEGAPYLWIKDQSKADQDALEAAADEYAPDPEQEGRRRRRSPIRRGGT